MPPYNFCRRRRQLYEPYLGKTAKFLSGLTDPSEDGVFASSAAKLSDALADEELIDALEEILIPYVLYGVLRDFARLRKSNALFRVDKNGKPPPLWLVLPTGGTSPDDLPGYSAESGVSRYLGYTRYFQRYITPANVDAEKAKPRSGIDAFYQRYPLLGYAVETLTSHYQKNVQLACERVLRDWDDIQKAFFGKRTLRALKKIATTGNDFHKGGKQVLILTFSLDDGSEGKVVYKPSAVEIDCRIVGNSTVFTNKIVSPKGPEDTSGYSQDASLTELINGFIHMPVPLPTYRILPYNRATVPDAYGYIEFLTHAPASKVECDAPQGVVPAVGAEIADLVKSQGPGAVKTSDWITDDTSDAAVFFHQLGGLMAMATAISLSDVHVQNMIVHRRLPHLIDLEDSLKRPMTRVTQTGMISGKAPVLNTYHDPAAYTVVLAQNFTSDLVIWRWAEPYSKSAAGILYLYRGADKPALPARIDAFDKRGFEAPDPEARKRDRTQSDLNRTALILGLEDVVGALADNVDEVKAWVRGLDKTLARFVTVATAAYADSGRHLYADHCETSVADLSRDGAPRAPDGWYAKVKPDEANQPNFFRATLNARVTAWSSGHEKDADWSPPFFALEHPDHVWRDYFNCDVPCFYHLLGDPDLLNSKGDRVDVDAAVKWQDRYMPGHKEVPDSWEAGDGAYLKTTPIEMICAQLDKLAETWAKPSQRRELLRKMVEGETSLAADLQFLPNVQVPAVSGR